MTGISYALAQTVLTEEQLLSNLLALLAAENVTTVGLSDFSAEMGLTRLNARAINVEQRIRAQLAGAISLAKAALAGDDYLDAVALGRYSETRLPALKTQGFLRATNTTASTITVDARTQIADGGGPLFENMEGWSLAAGAQAFKLFECRTAGSAGNVAVGAITRLQQGRAGLAVVNQTGWINRGGRDVEGSVAFVLRCIAKWGVQGRGGNLDAYNYLIPTLAPSITRWQIDDSNPGGPGTIWFHLANELGPASAQEVSDLTAALNPMKPLGSGEFSYFAATAHPVTIGCTLVTDGSNGSAATQGTAALNKLNAKFPLGAGTLQEELVKGILMGGAFPALGLDGFLGVTNLTGLTFTADEPFGTGKVLVITPTIVQV